MEFDIYQIDAFASKVFSGNPAAVIPLKEWLPDDILQKIAIENNLSETVYFIPTENGFHIRWFTPGFEVDLCGHATLATAYVLYEILNYEKEYIEFESRSGILKVNKSEEGYTLNFPTDKIEAVAPPPNLAKALSINIKECFKGKDDYLVITDDEKTVAEVKPDFRLLATLKARGVIVSAKGEDVDFVSRGFFPLAGIDEDPVTGSAHTTLTPYWAERLGKNELQARQISARGGELQCRLDGERVHITGKAVSYLSGKINVPLGN